jgi:RNA polymerase sigma-70 factor, ECF subfamily
VELDERKLVEGCLAGNQEACEAIVEANARMVGTIIWRTTGSAATVEDLAQETFLRVFRALPYFDGRAKLSTWIYTIAHRVAIDHVRKGDGWREQPLDDARTTQPKEWRNARIVDNPELIMAQTEMDRLVTDALKRLPEKYRLPLIYAAIDELDYPTIAAMLDLPLGTIKTHIFRAKRLLKDRILANLGVANVETGQ